MYAPIEVSESSVKEAFYPSSRLVVDSCPKGDTLIVLGMFSMQPLALIEMAISHVWVLTALDQELKLPNAPKFCKKSKTEDS